MRVAGLSPEGRPTITQGVSPGSRASNCTSPGGAADRAAGTGADDGVGRALPADGPPGLANGPVPDQRPATEGAATEGPANGGSATEVAPAPAAVARAAEPSGRVEPRARAERLAVVGCAPPRWGRPILPAGGRRAVPALLGADRADAGRGGGGGENTPARNEVNGGS